MSMNQRLDRLERRARGIGLSRFRPAVVVCSPGDVSEIEAARKAGARVYAIVNPDNAQLLGGSIAGVMISGVDLTSDV